MISGKGEKKILCAPHRAMKSKSEQVCFFPRSDDIHYKKTDSAVALADAFGGKGGGGSIFFQQEQELGSTYLLADVLCIVHRGWLGWVCSPGMAWPALA